VQPLFSITNLSVPSLTALPGLPPLEAVFPEETEQPVSVFRFYPEPEADSEPYDEENHVVQVTDANTSTRKASTGFFSIATSCFVTPDAD